MNQRHPVSPLPTPETSPHQKTRRLISVPFLNPWLNNAGRALQLAVVVVLIQSLFWTDRVPDVLKLATAALAALASVLPGEAVLVVAGLVPFTNVITTRVWNAYPLMLGEALVLAFLAGYLTRTWRWRDTGRIRAGSLSTPARFFALVILASCAVQFTVVRVWHDYPLAYARTFLAYLARDYLTTVPDPRPWVEGHGFVTMAALMLEGVALLLAVRALCRTQPGLEGRVLRMVVVAGAGAAVLNLLDVAEAVLRGEPALYSPVVGYRRWSTFIPSLNTSGPYFVLVAFTAFGLAAERRLRVGALGAGVLAIISMSLTRTRSAIVAVLATSAAGIVWLAALRTRLVRPRGAAAVAAVAALVLSVGVLAVDPWSMIRSDVYPWLHLRILLASTALRMLARYPFAGVGVGQYGIRFPDFGSPELLAVHPREDAHNYFLWIGAELGLVGLLPFLWLLGTTLRLAWRRLRANPGDLGFTGLCGGLAAFVVTWLTGQPLSVPVVAYTFWILLGVAAYAGSEDDASRRIGQSGGIRLTWSRAALAALVALVVVSVPIRARQATREIDLARVTYGFHLWETEGMGRRYRWTGPRTTFFARSSVRAVDLPLRAPFDPGRLGTEAFEVRIFVNHRRVVVARLTDDKWQQLSVPAPSDAERDSFWRIDLEVRPTWRPDEWLPGSTDRRELGVKVGEIGTVE